MNNILIIAEEPYIAKHFSIKESFEMIIFVFEIRSTFIKVPWSPYALNFRQTVFRKTLGHKVLLVK